MAEDWAHEVGITSSSFMHQVTPEPGAGQFTVFDLPKRLRDELGLRIIDINTNSLGSIEPAHAERFREEVDRAGCVVTNLKMNQRDIDMNDADPDVRAHALDTYRRSIDAAVLLGARWVRPLPPDETPDMTHHIDGWRAIADYAAEKEIRVLVEQYGYMSGDPLCVPKLIDAVDRNVGASPDTGSWRDNEVRYEGLANAFPLAVTCDYKAFIMGPDGEHADYDLKRCFTIGRDAGFRGPWCFEHWNKDTPTLWRELGMLRDMIGRWAAEGE